MSGLSGLSVWFLISLSVPMLWSIAHVFIKEELARTPVTPVQVTFFRVLVSAVFLLAMLVAVSPAALAGAFQALAQTTAMVMGLVYFVELVIWFYAVRHIDVSFAGSITTPWPALTMVLAEVFLGDTIESYQVMALVVVIACILGLAYAGVRKSQAAGSTIPAQG